VLLGVAPPHDQTIWEWDGSDWLPRETSGSFPREYLAATYDSVRREVIVFQAQTWRLRPAHPADYVVFGSGCRGSNGVPELAPAPGQWPWLGEEFTLELRDLPPSPFLLLLFGTSRVRWGPVALPVELQHLGMPQCTLWVSGEVVIPVVSAGGRANLTMRLPTEPSLVGAAFYNQSWNVDWLANPGLATTSSAGEGRLGAK
jgi:hypothetical protein